MPVVCQFGQSARDLCADYNPPPMTHAISFPTAETYIIKPALCGFAVISARTAAYHVRTMQHQYTRYGKQMQPYQTCPCPFPKIQSLSATEAFPPVGSYKPHAPLSPMPHAVCFYAWRFFVASSVRRNGASFLRFQSDFFAKTACICPPFMIDYRK